MGAMVDAFDRVFSGGATLPARIAGEGMALVNRSALAPPVLRHASGSWSIFAAQMKSFSDSPRIACVVKRTRQ